MSPARFGRGAITMDTRKKNLLLAALIAAFTIAMYVYSIYAVFVSKHPS